MPDTRRSTLIRVARTFGRAVGIVDPLRMRLWTECGLTMSQLRLLLLLREEPGITSGTLADRFNVHPSTITGHVEKLLRRGLIRRDEDDQDRRLLHIKLTSVGGELVGQIERTAGSFIIGLLEQLSEEQVARLEASLNDLLSVAQSTRRMNGSAPLIPEPELVAGNDEAVTIQRRRG